MADKWFGPHFEKSIAPCDCGWTLVYLGDPDVPPPSEKEVAELQAEASLEEKPITFFTKRDGSLLTCSNCERLHTAPEFDTNELRRALRTRMEQILLQTGKEKEKRNPDPERMKRLGRNLQTVTDQLLMVELEARGGGKKA